MRYGKGKEGIPGEHLYSHFLAECHMGWNDVRMHIIVRTDVTKPTEREGFGAFKLDSFISQGLNLIFYVMGIDYFC